MRSGLLPLALLGTTARGCFLRGSSPQGRGSFSVFPPDLAPDVKTLTEDDVSLSVRQRRIHGKRTLIDMCSYEPKFSQCQRDSGSALRLEKCLRSRQGTVSKTCRDGLRFWKDLLAETAHPEVNGKGPGNRKSSGPSAAMRDMNAHIALQKLAPEGRYAGKQADAGLPALSAHGEVDVFDDDDDVLPHEVFFSRPFGGLNQGHPEGLAEPHPIYGHHERSGTSYPLRKESRHMNQPHRGGPLPNGHLGGPPRDSRRRRKFQQKQQQLEGPRPSMFSVLVDWMLGESSSSDSADSSDSSSDSSSSDDSDHGVDELGFRSSQAEPGGPSASLVMARVEEEPFFPSPEHPLAGGQALGGKKRSEPFRRNRAEPAGPSASHLMALVEEEELFFTSPEHPLAGGQALGSKSRSKPLRRNRAEPAGPSASHVMALVENEESPFLSPEHPLAGGQALGSKSRSKSFRRNGAHPFILDPKVDKHAVPEPGLLPMGHGGGFPREHGSPHGRQEHGPHGRDHIRFRNRLPEDFENRRAWLADSLDGEDVDLVEGILALFFFIGAVTLLLLPFFLLGRALKKLVRGARGGSDAPDGYQALPDSATAVVAAAAARHGGGRGNDDDDDDDVVVTGTPVNPPPSVHL